MTIKLNTDQLFKYMYKPKLLCHDIYGNGELAFIIMEINDICNIKEFTKDTLLMPTKDNMNLITSRIFNSDKDDIKGMTKAVNGGYNGLKDREKKYNEYKYILGD